jgi:hypothetical protein
MEAPSELLSGSVSAASGPKVAAKFGALLPGWLVGEGLLRRMRLRAADDPAGPLVLIIETRPAGAINRGADSQSHDACAEVLAEVPAAGPPSPPPPLSETPAVDLLDDSVETAAGALAPMLAPPPPPPEEEDGSHGGSWQVAHTADFSAGEWWVRARGGGHGEVLVVRGFGAAGALPSQQAVPFELEVMEHPLGLAERCRWGTAMGEAGSAAQLQWHRRLLGYAAYCGGAGATVGGGGGGGGGGGVVVGGDMRQLLMSGGAGTEPDGLGWPQLLRRPRLFRHGGDEIAEVIARTCAQGLVCVCVCVCVCV